MNSDEKTNTTDRPFLSVTGREKFTPLAMTGEWLTRVVREDRDPDLMVKMLVETTNGRMTSEQARAVVDGRMELVGDSVNGLFIRPVGAATGSGHTKGNR